MYETVRKLHKLLRLLLLVLLIIIMILNPVNSRNCNGAVRTIQLYSEFTKGHVRIEGKKVVASNSINYMDQILQMITIDRHFLLYDPNAKMFICWNKSYTNLMAKRNPKNLSLCKFEEKTSIKRPAGIMTRYTTTYIKNSKKAEVELKFNKAGTFAFPRLVKRCLERRKRGRGKEQMRHHYKIDVDLMTNIDTLNINAETKNAYVQLSTYCADSDFIVRKDSINCSLGYSNFCEQMKRIHQRHPVAFQLQNLCNL